MPYDIGPPKLGNGPLRAGYAGGWFHPATGYSLAVALRLALFLARTPPHRVFGSDLDVLYEHHASQFRYAAFLNGMLFRFFAPDQMRNVFERFYGLPESLIGRFYAMKLSRSDRVRLLLGRPPKGMMLRPAQEARRRVLA